VREGVMPRMYCLSAEECESIACATGGGPGIVPLSVERGSNVDETRPRNYDSTRRLQAPPGSSSDNPIMLVVAQNPHRPLDSSPCPSITQNPVRSASPSPSLDQVFPKLKHVYAECV